MTDDIDNPFAFIADLPLAERQRWYRTINATFAFCAAKRSLLYRLRDPVRLVERRSFGGLARSFSSRQPPPVVPFGWKSWREPARDLVTVAPVWIYWWAHRWSPVYAVIERMIRRRSWLVGPEAGYYHEFRPRWWPRKR